MKHSGIDEVQTIAGHSLIPPFGGMAGEWRGWGMCAGQWRAGQWEVSGGTDRCTGGRRERVGNWKVSEGAEVRVVNLGEWGSERRLGSLFGRPNCPNKHHPLCCYFSWGKSNLLFEYLRWKQSLYNLTCLVCGGKVYWYDESGQVLVGDLQLRLLYRHDSQL